MHHVCTEAFTTLTWLWKQHCSTNVQISGSRDNDTNAICTFSVLCLSDTTSFLMCSVVHSAHSIASQEGNGTEFLTLDYSSKKKKKKRGKRKKSHPSCRIIIHKVCNKVQLITMSFFFSSLISNLRTPLNQNSHFHLLILSISDKYIMAS